VSVRCPRISNRVGWVFEFDLYMARVDVLPDEAVALITNALVDDGFREAESDGDDLVFEYGADGDITDEVVVTRNADGSRRLEITRSGWRYNDERFDQPHEGTLEFIPAEDGSKVEVTGWVREIVEDYLLALDLPFHDERLTTSYGLSYRKFVPGFIENLRREGWTEQPKAHRNETRMIDGRGGKAVIALQSPDTIVQIDGDLDGGPKAERFVISPVNGRTYVYISGNAPLLSLDMADAAAKGVVEKELGQISL
jgi:hypothetical protein